MPYILIPSTYNEAHWDMWLEKISLSNNKHGLYVNQKTKKIKNSCKA